MIIYDLQIYDLRFDTAKVRKNRETAMRFAEIYSS